MSSYSTLTKVKKKKKKKNTPQQQKRELDPNSAQAQVLWPFA